MLLSNVWIACCRRSVILGLALSGFLELGLGVPTANAGAVSPIYDSYSNSYLYIVGSPSSTWSQAEAQAQALGGNLITIHSAAEDQFVASSIFQNFTSSGGPNLSTGIQLWIGLTDPKGLSGTSETLAQHTANFVWVDGETSSYRDWSTFPSEPDNGNGGPHEYYSAMWGPDGSAASGGESTTTGTWNDTAETYVSPNLTTGFYGVAEVPVPEPTSMVLIGFCVMLGVRRRR